MVTVNTTSVSEARLERVAVVSAAVFMAALALFVYLLVATSVPTAPATVQNPAQVVPGTTQPGPGEPNVTPGTPSAGTEPAGGGNPGGGVVIPPIVPPDQTTEPADPHAGQTWHEPWDEQVMVSGAWTEYIEHPAVYQTVHHNAVGHYGDRCNQCGREITGYAPQHLEDNVPNCWSYTNYYWFVDSPAWDEQVLVSGAWTESIYHPATYKTIHHEGYWE